MIVIASRLVSFTSYFLRQIPAETWRLAKTRAAKERKTMRELFLAWLERYARGR